MPKTEFNDLTALRAVISGKREASSDNNALVPARTLEPIYAAILRLTTEVEELRQEVKRLKFRHILAHDPKQDAHRESGRDPDRALPPR